MRQARYYSVLFLLTLLPIVVEAGIYTDPSGVMYEYNTDTREATVPSGQNQALEGFISIKNSFVVDGTEYQVTSIADDAFNSCQFAGVIVPSSVTSIGSAAFIGCRQLVTVEVKGQISSVADNLFNGCSKLEKVILPNSVRLIGNNAFGACRSLETINIPDGVTAIGEQAFYLCSFESMILPNSVTEIGKLAFRECQKLSSVVLSENLTEIKEKTFYGCKELKTISIPNSVTTLGTGILSCSGVTSLTLGEGVTQIDTNVFSFCEDLTSITIPDNVKVIYSFAFSNCPKLTSVVIGKGLENISGSAFYQCGHLTVTFHCPRLPYMRGSFDNLEGVILGKEVTNTSSLYFSEEELLSSIIVDGENPVYDSRDNCNAIIETASNTMIQGCKNTSIPNTVVAIKGFYRCKGLTSIHIPKSVKKLSEFCFEECENLRDVSVEALSPSDITLETLGRTSAFSTIASDAVLTVPKGRKAAYEASSIWKNCFAQIVEGDNSTEVEFVEGDYSYHGDYVTGELTITRYSGNETNYLTLPSITENEGINYTVTNVAANAFVGEFNVICFPSTFTGISANALSSCRVKSLVWKPKTKLPAEVISNSSLKENGNWLLYISGESYAPANVRNVVVGFGKAERITLTDDGGDFYCPNGFTANTISYTHHYTMPTVKGTCQGWETLALPFDVMAITHEREGEIIPFLNYTNIKDRPFWLYAFNTNGFAATDKIEANKPYLLSMPNDPAVYDEEYLLAGQVTFTGINVRVRSTEDISAVEGTYYSFIPTYLTVEATPDVYALNVHNDYSTATAGAAPGSRFVSGLRDVRPFEAYMKTIAANARGIIDIDFADAPTDITDMMLKGGSAASGVVSIYTVNGTRVMSVKGSQLNEAMRQLPHGIYVIGGKKIVL